MSDEKKLGEGAPSPLPVRTDGRGVDPSRGILSGEASGQLARGPIEAPPPVVVEPGAPTYYGLPALKQPVWKPTVPLYFYVGGAAGAASVLGLAAMVFGRGELEGLQRRTRWMSFAGDLISGGLLIDDLGRPSRFLNMLRVFRPTSPMSVGSWIVAGSGASSSLALLAERPGLLGKLGRLGEIGAGVFGLGLAGYTGVLVSNTAIPVWQLANRRIPILFMGSSMASAAALLSFTGLTPREDRVVRRFGVVGRATELAAMESVEAAVKRVPEAARPLQEGPTGSLWRTAKLLSAASLVLSVVPTKSRGVRQASAVLGTLGSLAMRYALVRAGTASSRDPKASFAAQRQGHGGEPHRAELTTFPLKVIR